MFKALGIIYVFDEQHPYPSGHLVPSLYLIHPAIQLTRLTPSSMDIGYRGFFSYQLAQ